MLRICVALVLCFPTTAAAQRLAFVDALIAFHSALFGTYGDEGREVTAALDRMSASLDVWERTRRESEAELRGRQVPAPSDWALFHAGGRQFDAAIAAMKEAVAAEPARAALHLYLGRLHEEAGQRAEAAAAFGRARALDPSDPIAAYLLGLQVSESTTFDEDAREEVFRSLLPTLMDAYDRRVHLRGFPIPDFALIDDLAAPARVFAPAAYESGFALVGQGRFREALAAFRASAARDPLVSDPAGRSEQVVRGVAALRDRRGPAAVQALEAAVVERPLSSEAHRVLAVVYRAVGRLPEAIARFEEAIRLAPDDERARVALGSTLIEAGRLDEAERALRETIARLPASGEARWALADLCERQERGTEAIRQLEDAASLIVVAGKVHLYFRIAQIAHAQQRDHARVIDVLTRRVRLVPNEPHAHKDLGLAYSRAGREDEALLELMMTTLLGHEDAEVLTAIGQIRLNQGRLDRAEVALARAVQIDPAFAEARYACGRTLQRLGRTAEAAAQLEEFDRLRARAFDAQRRQFEDAVTAPRGTPSSAPNPPR